MSVINFSFHLQRKTAFVLPSMFVVSHDIVFVEHDRKVQVYKPLVGFHPPNSDMFVASKSLV